MIAIVHLGSSTKPLPIFLRHLTPHRLGIFDEREQEGEVTFVHTAAFPTIGGVPHDRRRKP